MTNRLTVLACCAALLVCLFPRNGLAQAIGNHRAVYDKNGYLLPWTSWRDALNREMNWYANCPQENGYPRFITVTFMDGSYHWIRRRKDMIPAMQHGMGILSYLKYYAWTQRKDPRILGDGPAMGDYLITEALTPNTGKYPRFFRSTGRAGVFPQAPSCGCQADLPYETQPDKAGIAGYALVLLTEETKDDKYLQIALDNARTLVVNMRPGDAQHSPWPFRVDFRTGAGRGEIGANQSYILRLFDKLIAHGYTEFAAPRAALWSWIKTYQIPSAAKDGKLWVQFFEDYAIPSNRNSWSPMNLARYLLEQRDALDPDWKRDAKTLIDFVIANFTSIQNGVPVCGEQDDDKKPWGGALSNYGSTLAMYSAATGSKEYKALAYQALNYCLYAINNDGCPGQSAIDPGRGGWQEDAHTDVIHNFMDAIAAFPEWGK